MLCSRKSVNSSGILKRSIIPKERTYIHASLFFADNLF